MDVERSRFFRVRKNWLVGQSLKLLSSSVLALWCFCLNLMHSQTKETGSRLNSFHKLPSILVVRYMVTVVTALTWKDPFNNVFRKWWLKKWHVILYLTTRDSQGKWIKGIYWLKVGYKCWLKVTCKCWWERILKVLIQPSNAAGSQGIQSLSGG